VPIAPAPVPFGKLALASIWQKCGTGAIQNLAPVPIAPAPVPIWQRCGTGAIQNLAPVPKCENAWHRCHLKNWHQAVGTTVPK